MEDLNPPLIITFYALFLFKKAIIPIKAADAKKTKTLITKELEKDE